MSARTIKSSKPYRLPHIGHFVIAESPVSWWGEDEPEKGADVINNPASAAKFWRRWIQPIPFIQSKKEHLVVIPLSTVNRAHGWHLVSMGVLNQTNAHPREILRPVIIAGANSLLMMHNHPSGGTQPSDADRLVTRTLLQCCKDHLINFADHVIVGDGTGDYFSFREAQLTGDDPEPAHPPAANAVRPKKRGRNSR